MIRERVELPRMWMWAGESCECRGGFEVFLDWGERMASVPWVYMSSISCLWKTRLGDFAASVRSLIGYLPLGHLDPSPQISTRQRTSVRTPCPFLKRHEE